jgi:hypothetical protein
MLSHHPVTRSLAAGLTDKSDFPQLTSIIPNTKSVLSDFASTTSTMSPEGEILPGASIAAVYLNSGIRVYFQDVDGYVRESRREGDSWRGGGFKDIVFRAKLGTPLAATSLSDSRVSPLSSLPVPNFIYQLIL